MICYHVCYTIKENSYRDNHGKPQFRGNSVLNALTSSRSSLRACRTEELIAKSLLLNKAPIRLVARLQWLANLMKPTTAQFVSVQLCLYWFDYVPLLSGMRRWAESTLQSGTILTSIFFIFVDTVLPSGCIYAPPSAGKP